MALKYPDGRSFQQSTPLSQSKHTSIQYGNRGMTLEQEINATNKYYRVNGIAVIHKKPIPIQIVNVDYPKRSAAVIREAYFKQPSTTDYNGVYQGHYLDFEAKETRNKTAFPLSNFHAHQVEHLKACMAQNGICFTIVRFTILDELYLMPAATLFRYWDQQANITGRKSIPRKVIATEGISLQYGLNPRIPYLSAVDQLI
ncbi:Holliday junction resolvase RecU [Ligilactobacillus sp. LYQ60]|uniref:Holliday junction resolvase RecU n=1 Tax=unclassified Ligilactobacillus TaxID=2767920 RepID=UPI003851E5BD